MSKACEARFNPITTTFIITEISRLNSLCQQRLNWEASGIAEAPRWEEATASDQESFLKSRLTTVAHCWLSFKQNCCPVLHFIEANAGTSLFARGGFSFVSVHGKKRKSREKRGNLDQMVLPRLSSKHGFSPSKPLMETQTFQSRRGVNTRSSVSNRSLHRGVGLVSVPAPVCSCVRMCVGVVGERLAK